MLNYTVPPLQFLIGGFDASQYLDSISLALPMHEPGQALLWAGQFKVSNNLATRLAGLVDADFTEVSTPGRWRPYQQQVRLIIRGYPSPIFRIENYRYNSQTNSGEGRLTQIPMAVAGDRPGVSIETKVSGSIGLAIDNLLAAAFKDATVSPSHAAVVDAGVLDVPLVTRDPWADAVRLSGLSWNWLTVDTAESIVSVNGSGGGVVFNRIPEQVELVPDLAAIFQPVCDVIVTGARQVEDKTVAAKATTNTAPRPKFRTTTEYRPAGSVFPSLGTSMSSVAFEEKTIIYQYWNDSSLAAFLFDIGSQTQSGINRYGIPPADLNTPLQTIAIKRQPVGYLFPSEGAATTLTEGEVIIESSLRKLTLKPAGVILPSLGTNLNLAVDKRETLTSAAIPLGAQLTAPETNANGQTQVYEPRPTLESQQPIATRPLKTEVLKGTAALTPLGWTPILRKPLVVDFGFLPDQARAEYLARKIAEREQWRRDQVLVDMPIPSEWLAGGWQPLGRCQIGGATYLMDGCAISISDREARFGFTGALISGSTGGGVSQALYQIDIDVPATIVLEAEVVSAEAVNVSAELIFELILWTGIGGSAPPTVVLTGGGYGSTDIFTLGNAEGSYYAVNGDNDYASVINFERGFDTIELSGADDYVITFANGINSLYRVAANGDQDLIARIASATALDLNANYFTYVY
jgi:hypothetical protein